MTRTAEKTATTATTWTAVQPWLSLVLRIGLAIVFLWSGIQKISDIAQSQIAVRSYELLPEAIVHIAGIALPVLELLAGVLLLAGMLTRLAAIGFGLLMIVFIIGISSAWARGLSIDCGCFGGGGQVTGDQSATYAWEIARDVGLLLCATVLAIWPWSKYSADHALGVEPPRKA